MEVGKVWGPGLFSELVHSKYTQRNPVQDRGMLPSSGATGKKHFPDSLSCPQAVICTAWPLLPQVTASVLREKLGR